MTAPAVDLRTLSPAGSPYLHRNAEAHLVRWGIALPTAPAGDRVLVQTTPRRSASTPQDDALWPPDAVLSARVRDTEGQWRKMHSDRAPREEAEAWWASLRGAVGAAPALALVGVGLGYLLDVLESATTRPTLVLEPEADLVPWLLARRDWTRLIAAGRLLLLPGPSFDAAPRAWGILARAPRHAPHVVVHPVTARTHPDAATTAAAALSSVLQASRANALARRRFQSPYLRNTLANLGRVHRAHPLAALDGLATGRPVVIAGAGPSLNRNIEELRPHRERVCLVATDTALRPLLTAGVVPDVVVAVDPGPLNARHLTGLEVPRRTTLVAEASVDPAALEPFGERVVLFRVADHAPWRWLTRVGVDPGTLRAWGSVVTSAFDLALRLGGTPIVFIGADLAYTDGQPYCRGTRYEDDWADAIARDGRSLADVWAGATRDATTATDVDGRSTGTVPHLVAYRDWLVQACADAATAGGARVINATGAGILHGAAITQATLATTLAAWPPSCAGPIMSLPRAEPTAASVALDPIDAHLLRHLRQQTPPVLPDVPPPTVTPYMRRTRGERLRETQRLRAAGRTDTARWQDNGNLDLAWERRAAAAALLVPPGMRVLDLGAGLEALERHLPAGTTYVPADVVARTPRTIVVDVNRGRLPAGRFDVVAMLGLLEYVHAPKQLLRAWSGRASLLVASYCALTRGPAEARLQRGWMNDLTLPGVLDTFADAGWDVAWATCLDSLDDCDQWLFACRPAGQR